VIRRDSVTTSVGVKVAWKGKNEEMTPVGQTWILLEKNKENSCAQFMLVQMNNEYLKR
jgi:hypothetical protein